MFWGTLNFSVTLVLVRPFSRSLRVRWGIFIARTVFFPVDTMFKCHYLLCYTSMKKPDSFLCLEMQCNIIYLFPQFFVVFSTDLVLTVVNNKEPMEIILLICFEIDSTVMWFHVYQNNWEAVIEKILKTCMEPQNKVN